jgi:nitrogenase molybdenum-iron protein beta chain
LEAELFVVLSGCVPALIGDDVASVVARHRRRGVPIVLAETSGYQGNNFTGHEIVVRAIIDQFADRHAGPTQPGRVNVWSLLPYQHPFWRGDLEEIHRLLEGIGLEVNILFGHSSQGVDEWRRVPRAEFNLVLGPWLGVETARHLEQKYGQPFLHLPTLPIGARETGRFLRQVADFTGRDRQQVERFIAAEERRYYLYLRDFSSFYAGCTSQYQLPSALVVVSDSAYALAVTAFMIDQLGLVPACLVVTENPPEEARPGIAAAFRAVVGENDAPVHFADDGYEIDRILRATDLTGHLPILFGTTWEGEAAKALDAPLIEIGYPCTDEVVLSRAYLGYRGALHLIERIYTTVVRAETMG